MKQYIFLFLMLKLPFYCVSQQVDYDNSVRFYAEDVNNGLLIKWVKEDGVNNYIISKRLLGEANYKLLSNVPGSENEYLDTSSDEKLFYEYKVTKSKSNASISGFMCAGRKVIQRSSSGHILLLIKSNIADALSTEIQRYEYDLQMENWITYKEIISDTHTVEEVKNIIKTYYDLYPLLKSVCLIGHIPVPYSGLINPDGHPDHQGAWPCDAYYADMDGFWTDANINNDLATGFRNDNVPEDGKFDQSTIGKVELEIGRVDFSNLPAFPTSEIELTRKYFDKNHDFRNGKIKFKHRGLIQNNFPSFTEAFGQSGVNNFSRMFGPDSVFYLPYKATLQNEDYLWSYGCGPGNYTGAGGIGNTFELVNENHKTVFTMVFGSYFGDWDNENNYLRAALASGSTLTNVWAGRPHWYFQHMAMGYNIGYSTKLTQNNGSEFPTGFGGKGVHIALMGDPSLTMYPYEAIEEVTYTQDKNIFNLYWKTIDTTGIIGYKIFIKGHNSNHIAEFTEVDKSTFTTWIPCLQVGKYDLIVKAIKLQKTASGSFINQSIAKAVTVTVEDNFKPIGDFETEVYYDLITTKPSIENGEFTAWIINQSFENKVDTFLNYLALENGSQEVCLISSNVCEYTVTCKDIVTTSSLPEFEIIKSTALCFGDTISNEIKIIKENAPFNVVWEDGSTGLKNDNITNQSIAFTMTTSTGRTNRVIVVNEFPDKLTLSGITSPETENGSKGSIQLFIDGGNPPYTHLINGDTSTAALISDLSAGEYIIEVIDANDCRAIDTFAVEFITSTNDSSDDHPGIQLVVDNYHVSLKNQGTSILRASVFNTAGQKMGDFLPLNNKNEWYFNHKELPSALYLAQIEINGIRIIKKWIK